MDSGANLHSVISHAEFKGLTEACNMIQSLENMAVRLTPSYPDTARTLKKLAHEEIIGMVNYCAEVEATAEDLLKQQEEERRRAIADGDGVYVEGPPMGDVATSEGGHAGPGRVSEVRSDTEEALDPKPTQEG